MLSHEAFFVCFRLLSTLNACLLFRIGTLFRYPFLFLTPLLGRGDTANVNGNAVCGHAKGWTTCKTGALVTWHKEMTRIGLHEILHHLRFFRIEVAEVSVNDGGQCIVRHLLSDDIDAHLPVIVLKDFAEFVFHLLLCVFRQRLQRNRIPVIIGIETVCININVTTMSDHRMGDNQILLVHTIVVILYCYWQSKCQRQIVQMIGSGQLVEPLA